jgi:hypothetical protein
VHVAECNTDSRWPNQDTTHSQTVRQLLTYPDSGGGGGGFSWQRPVGGGGWQASKPPLQRHTVMLSLRLHWSVPEQSLSDVQTLVGTPAGLPTKGRTHDVITALTRGMRQQAQQHVLVGLELSGLLTFPHSDQPILHI